MTSNVKLIKIGDCFTPKENAPSHLVEYMVLYFEHGLYIGMMFNSGMRFGYVFKTSQDWIFKYWDFKK